MNVPMNIQGPGSVSTLPRQVSGGDAASANRAETTVRMRRSSDAMQATITSYTRLAWFDVNGDGNIDPRSASAGGDATLLVPAHAVDLPTYSRPVSPGGNTHIGPVRVAGEPSAAGNPPNPARTNRAVDAYQRYGQPPDAAQPAAAIAPSGAPVGDAVAPVVVGLQAQASAQAMPVPGTPRPSASPDVAPVAERAVA